jgi:calcium/calmodulin-dependent protein kinase I
MVQISDVLVYLHGIPAIHRDIKPSNVLCERAEDGSVKLVLADFGLATYIKDKKNMSRRCGTGGYIAPEMFHERWTNEWMNVSVKDLTKVDVFSFGMLLYVTAFGNNPFFDASPALTYKRNSRGLLSLTDMGGRSDPFKSLLSGLCATNPRRRLSSKEARADPWFSSDGSGASCSDGERKCAKVAWNAFELAARGSRTGLQETRSL